MSDLTSLLGDSRKQLLDLIQVRGEVTAHQAAEALELAVTTVRQHLEKLEDEELIERQSRPAGRGRPTLYFRLTSRAQKMYPSVDRQMLIEMLEFLGREGYHRAIDEFFRHYWEKRRDLLHQRLDTTGAETLQQRLEVVRQFLDDQGFMPRIAVTDDGTVQIRECNCPLRSSVETTRLPCRLEAQLLEQVLGESLSRVEYMPDGYPACMYEFASGDGVDDAD